MIECGDPPSEIESHLAAVKKSVNCFALALLEDMSKQGIDILPRVWVVSSADEWPKRASTSTYLRSSYNNFLEYVLFWSFPE